jgi:hypothetical protein
VSAGPLPRARLARGLVMDRGYWHERAKPGHPGVIERTWISGEPKARGRLPMALTTSTALTGVHMPQVMHALPTTAKA